MINKQNKFWKSERNIKKKKYFLVTLLQRSSCIHLQVCVKHFWHRESWPEKHWRTAARNQPIAALPSGFPDLERTNCPTNSCLSASRKDSQGLRQLASSQQAKKGLISSTRSVVFFRVAFQPCTVQTWGFSYRSAISLWRDDWLLLKCLFPSWSELCPWLRDENRTHSEKEKKTTATCPL